MGSFLGGPVNWKSSLWRTVKATQTYCILGLKHCASEQRAKPPLAGWLVGRGRCGVQSGFLGLKDPAASAALAPPGTAGVKPRRAFQFFPESVKTKPVTVLGEKQRVVPEYWECIVRSP
jgi:hypothetical protein